MIITQKKLTSVPCWFCKSSKVVVISGGVPIGMKLKESYEYKFYYYVECTACRATGPRKSQREEAVQAWNGRGK